MNTIPCPCGSDKLFTDCCHRYLSGNQVAPTAEALMRSRYSAYATQNMEYIEQTYHSDNRKTLGGENIEQAAAKVKWIGLEIVSSEKGMASDEEGFVDFIARYEEQNKQHAMREKSRFVKEDGRWFYVDGLVKTLPQKASQKLGRNDPCSCGSGKKFKKCCGQ